MALIDLGVLDDDGWQVPAPVGSGRPPSSRRWPVAVAMLVVVGLFAAGSLPVAGVESVVGLPELTLGFAADGDNLYAIREDPSITAYGWRAGETRWTRSLAPSEGQLYLAAGRSFIRHRPCTQSTGWSLEGLDAVTGQQRWLGQGGPLTVLGGARPSLLMVDEPSAACPVVRPPITAGQVTQQPPMRLSALDVDTGATRWAFSLRSGRLAVPDENGGSWFAVWYADGRAEVHDAATGAALSSGVLPELADGPPQAVRVIGDLLIVVSAELDGATLTAYHHNGFALAWRRPFLTAQPAPIAELAYGPTVIGCGPMICVPSWRELVVLDAGSGVTVWRREVQLDAVGPGVLVARERADFMHTRVLEWRTGRDVVDLGGWGVVPMVGDDPIAPHGAPPAVALVQRPDGPEARLAAVDLRTGQLRPLGTIAPIPSRCAVNGRRLACLARGDTVHLWRLPG